MRKDCQGTVIFRKHRQLELSSTRSSPQKKPRIGRKFSTSQCARCRRSSREQDHPGPSAAMADQLTCGIFGSRTIRKGVVLSCFGHWRKGSGPKLSSCLFAKTLHCSLLYGLMGELVEVHDCFNMPHVSTIFNAIILPYCGEKGR